MLRRRCLSLPAGRARQGGQVALIVVVILAFGIAALAYTLVTPSKVAVENDRRTAEALEQARQALIGYAAGIVYSGATDRPGNLPCPDTSGFGNQDASCNSAGLRIGRLPWKTLGLPDLRDGHGEPLWYAVSDTYKQNPQSGTLNSDTPGELTVTGTPPASQVIAIVFSAGPVVGTQDRNPSTAATCATYGVSKPNNLCPINYLEGTNATAGTTFTSGATSATFNDRLLAITRDMFFPAVEARVARELRVTFRSYYATNNYYPPAAPLPGTAISVGTDQGYPPTAASSCYTGIAVPTYPSWFTANNWHQMTVYAVAPRCTPGYSTQLLFLGTQDPCSLWCIPIFGSYLCLLPNAMNLATLNCANTAAGGYLTVNGVSSSVEALVMSAGRRLGTQPARPCSTMSGCLEDAENVNADNVYVTPVRSSTNNDGLVVIGP